MGQEERKGAEEWWKRWGKGEEGGGRDRQGERKEDEEKGGRT